MLTVVHPDEITRSDVYDRYGITPTFRPSFDELIDGGEIDNAEFRLRLLTCANYRQCAEELVAPDRLPPREEVPRYWSMRKHG